MTEELKSPFERCNTISVMINNLAQLPARGVQLDDLSLSNTDNSVSRKTSLHHASSIDPKQLSRLSSKADNLKKVPSLRLNSLVEGVLEKHISLDSLRSVTSKLKTHSSLSSPDHTIGDISRQCDENPLGLNQSFMVQAQLLSEDSLRGQIISDRQEGSGNWLLEAQNYLLSDKKQEYKDSTLSVQSFVSLDDNQTEESVMESVSIVSIPFKKLSSTGGFPKQPFKRREKSSKSKFSIGHEPKQNQDLLKHIESGLPSSDFSTPQKMEQTQKIQEESLPQSAEAFSDAKRDLLTESSKSPEMPKEEVHRKPRTFKPQSNTQLITGLHPPNTNLALDLTPLLQSRQRSASSKKRIGSAKLAIRSPSSLSTNSGKTKATPKNRNMSGSSHGSSGGAQNRKEQTQQIKEASEKEEDSNTYRFKGVWGLRTSRRENFNRGEVPQRSGKKEKKNQIFATPTGSQTPGSGIGHSSFFAPASTTTSTKIPHFKMVSPQKKKRSEEDIKTTLPEDEEPFMIKSSRESQAKQPYTSICLHNSRQDSVNTRKSGPPMSAGAARSKATTNSIIGRKRVSAAVHNSPVPQLIKKVSNNKSTTSFSEAAAVENTEATEPKVVQDKYESSALVAMQRYYDKLLDERDRSIEKHKGFITQLKSSLQSLLVEHSKCKNDLERTRTELSELKKIHEGSGMRKPGQSMRVCKEKEDLETTGGGFKVPAPIITRHNSCSQKPPKVRTPTMRGISVASSASSLKQKKTKLGAFLPRGQK